MIDKRTDVFVQQYRRQGETTYLLATEKFDGEYGVAICHPGDSAALQLLSTPKEADEFFYSLMLGLVNSGWMRNGDPYLSSVKVPPNSKVRQDWLDMTVMPIVRRGPRPTRTTV